MKMASSAGSSVLSSMSPEERRKQMVRAVVASTVGTSIEWYDYFLFGTMAGLVFPHLFFPKSDQLAGTLNSYAIFFVGFLARPVWAWRMPFLLSIVLVAVGLYIRLGIMETPVFQALLQERRTEPAPVREVIRRNWREIILSALLRLPEQAPFYLFTVFVFTFGASATKLDKPFLTWAVSVAGLVSFISIPLFGHLSDRVGRKTIYMAGIVVMAIWGFLYFGLYATAIPIVVFIVIALSLIPHDMQYGPQASLIAESFTGRLRYSGASLGYQFASIIAGGPAPSIALGIWTGFLFIGPWKLLSPLPAKNPYMISLYILACCVVGFIAVALLKDRSAYA